MNTCYTCEHWNAKPFDAINGIGLCERIGVHAGLDEKLPPKGEMIVNIYRRSSLSVNVVTEQDFGCALHESK